MAPTGSKLTFFSVAQDKVSMPENTQVKQEFIIISVPSPVHSYSNEKPVIASIRRAKGMEQSRERFFFVYLLLTSIW